METTSSIALLAAALVLGCAPVDPPIRCAWDASAAQPAAASQLRFRASAGPAAEQLCVSIDVPAGRPRPGWLISRSLAPYVRDVAFSRDGGAFRAADPSSGAWQTPGCGEGACKVRYRVLLRSAADDLDDSDTAREHRGTLIAPPSSWLLRPVDLQSSLGLLGAPPPRPAPYSLRVATPPGMTFTSGLFLDPADPGAFRGDLAEISDAPYAAFGALAVKRVELPGGSLDVAFEPGRTALPRAAISAWIDTSARAIASYFGRFPIEHAAVVVIYEPGRGVGHGRTMGTGGASILLTLGEDVTQGALDDDWILVHELVHVSFPNVLTPWAEEGMATYLEPLIRARAGMVSPDEVWRSMIEGMPQGLPEPGDLGLDRTDSWGRRYWGGALFWFQADLEIRRRTGNKKSIDDAFRGISDRGGNVAVTWDLDRALAVGDEATGVPVLVPLRKQMGGSPVTVDLDAVWKSLGVSVSRGRVVYDDTAPLAAARRGIITGR